jgi:hypothetical protein
MSMTEQGLTLRKRPCGAGQRKCGRRATHRSDKELVVREAVGRFGEPWRLTDSPTLAALAKL